MARVVALLFACGGMLLAAGVLYGVSMSGFPDGHRTDWDRVVHFPRMALGIASFLVAGWLAWLGALGDKSRLGKNVAIGVFLLAMLVGMELLGLELVRRSLGIDHGQGG
jgi:hypothetical protein